MKKTFKKVLSVVLSIAMIAASVTIYNTTAKADETIVVSDQPSIDVETIEDWTALAGPSDDGATAYVSAAVEMGNAGLRGFYGAGKSTGWNISENMKNVPVFGFVTAGGNASAIIINGLQYVNNVENEDVYIGSDCVYINQSLLTAAAGETKYYTITAVDSAGTGTFALKVVGEPIPDQDISNIDTSSWTDIPVTGALDNTYAVNTADFTANINAAIFGVWADHTQSAYHPAICTLDGGVFATARKNIDGGSMKAIWIDGVKYKSGTQYFFADGDQCHIAESLFDLNGAQEKTFVVSVVGNVTQTFAVKVTAPGAETPPDQTLDPVDDWVQVPNNSAAGTQYFVSEAFRNANINHVDIFGLYTDHTESPYHEQVPDCTLTSAAYVSAWPSIINEGATIKAVWIDGVKYTTGTEVCYISGDQVHLAQSLFTLPTGEDEKVFAVTIVTSTGGELTYGIKVAQAPAVPTYEVLVDGTKVADVEEGSTYVLPAEAEYGYYDAAAEKMYAAGEEITVTGAVSVVSVDEMSITMAQGAGIRIAGDQSGLRFQASISTDSTEVLDSAFVTEGTLITANDLFANKGNNLDLESTYTFLDIKNVGWYNNNVGSFCGSIVNIIESNYIRGFIARSYVKITYSNGDIDPVYVYSNMSAVRSIKQVATSYSQDPNSNYNELEGAAKTMVDSYINAK